MTRAPVLLCYDGSDEARRAIRVAGELLGGPALVLTVWEPFELSLLSPVGDAIAIGSGLGGEFDELAGEAASKIAAEGAEVAREAGLDASPLARRGHPREVILDTARELHARAIVLGSRGRGGVESALLGSVSTELLHHCRDVPLLVVPAPAS
jgi:nucleotide-binding universal stress UspA family protein